jgi:XTP/dITP diphosphohydrolase
MRRLRTRYGALGEPLGVSARYGGDGLSDADRTELLLKNMRGMEQRDAKFVSSIACVFPNGDILTAEGECRGEITQTPSGSGGFGYDPVFFLRKRGRHWRKCPRKKHAVSHRGHALRELKRRLENYLTAH